MPVPISARMGIQSRCQSVSDRSTVVVSISAKIAFQATFEAVWLDPGMTLNTSGTRETTDNAAKSALPSAPNRTLLLTVLRGSAAERRVATRDVPLSATTCSIAKPAAVLRGRTTKRGPGAKGSEPVGTSAIRLAGPGSDRPNFVRGGQK